MDENAVTIDKNPLVSVRNLSKSFSGAQALKRINLDIMPGAVHCLAGTNGSGKSTLIKVISGVEMPDAGSEIQIDCDKIVRVTPDLAKKQGIQVIYQDLSLFPDLSVAENIAFDRNMQGLFKWHSKQKVHEKARQVRDEMNFDLDLNEQLGNLSIGERQQVAICRALVARARLVIMDEPTASLTRTEVRQLLKITRDLKNRNIGVIFVSHRLDEVLEISDTVTVIRDGALVGSYPAPEISPSKLTELMTGSAVQSELSRRGTHSGKVILEVQKLTRKGQYRDISFKIHEGEVLGLSGLLGSGRTELALSLFGITRPDSGALYLNRVPVRFTNPRAAIKRGIGYVSEDRLTLGLIVQQSVADNIVLSILQRLSNRIRFIDSNKKKRRVAHAIEQFAIRVFDPDNPVATLSGGNQQKVVLAKWMLTQPKLLILDSPTVGVDIAAKNGIYQLIHRLSEQGISVLLISDEIQEVYYNCDRILHMEHGALIDEYTPKQISASALEAAVNG